MGLHTLLTKYLYSSFQKFRQPVVKLKVDLGKWILIDKQGHSIQTTWQNFGYNSAVFGSITPEDRSRELIACVPVQDRKRIEIMDILDPKKLDSRQNTKTRPTKINISAPDQHTPLLQSTVTLQNDYSIFSASAEKVYFALGCILAIIIAMYLLYLATGSAYFSYFIGSILLYIYICWQFYC